MMTFLVYIEEQDVTIIYIEEIILQVLILFQENNFTAVTDEYNHTGTKSIHVEVLIECGC
jgi:hypothetical protein